MGVDKVVDNEALFVSNINFVEMINNVCASGLASLFVCFKLIALQGGWWLVGWDNFFELSLHGRLVPVAMWIFCVEMLLYWCASACIVIHSNYVLFCLAGR